MEISQNSQEITCDRVSFLIKLQTLLKKRPWYKCFPVNFMHFLRTHFFTEHLRWLLLYMDNPERNTQGHFLTWAKVLPKYILRFFHFFFFFFLFWYVNNGISSNVFFRDPCLEWKTFFKISFFNESHFFYKQRFFSTQPRELSFKCCLGIA